MSSSYIPANDLEFTEWLDRFSAYLTANLAKFGIVDGEIDDLLAAIPQFQTDYQAAKDARATAKAKTQAKDASRMTAEDILRPLVGRIQSYPATTNEDRAELGIPLKGVNSTPSSVVFADDRPSAIIDIRPALKHIIRIHNESTTGTSKGKPAGAIGCEVWVKIGDAPASISELSYVETVTKNPFTMTFQPGDERKQAHYRLRWVGRNGVKGDWAEIDSATIAA